MPCKLFAAQEAVKLPESHVSPPGASTIKKNGKKASKPSKHGAYADLEARRKYQREYQAKLRMARKVTGKVGRDDISAE